MMSIKSPSLWVQRLDKCMKRNFNINNLLLDSIFLFIIKFIFHKMNIYMNTWCILLNYFIYLTKCDVISFGRCPNVSVHSNFKYREVN